MHASGSGTLLWPQGHVGLLFALALALAASVDSAEPAAETEVGLAPERLALSLTDSPATSIAITWRTSAPTAAPSIQLAQANAGSELAAAARSIPARTEVVALSTTAKVWHHSAVVRGLEPDTLYAYRAGSGNAWSEWNHFRTAHRSRRPFRFLFFGDPQNGLKEYCTRTFLAGFAKAPDCAFYLTAGDLVTATTDDALWAELFHALGPLCRVTPGLHAVGNHEYGQFQPGADKRKTLSPLFRAHFTQPVNGPEGLAETAWVVDYQGARFICLNGNERLEEQASWLERVLRDNPNRWTIVLMHQPVYSTGKQRDKPTLRETFLPIYDKHAVDLVLQGHDHTYGRTYKLRAGRRVDDAAAGTVYVVSVAGPKFYPVNPAHADLMARLDTGKQLYQVITIADGTLEYEAWTVTGELHDRFTITKTVPAE